MGMYTQVYIQARLPGDAPQEVIHAARLLFDETYDRQDHSNLPNHRFFSLPRWHLIGNCCSYYFIPMPVRKMLYDDIGKYWSIISCSDLKNYDGEIQEFFDWIIPHLEVSPGGFVGYYQYEEFDKPTLVFAPIV